MDVLQKWNRSIPDGNGTAAAFQPDVSSMLPGQEFSVFVRPLPQSHRSE